MRAVLYLRVSTVEQVSNLSLDTQERACRDQAVVVYDLSRLSRDTLDTLMVHGASGSRAAAHLRGAHRMKPPEELDRIADKVLAYRPKDKAKKLRKKAVKAKKRSPRGKR